MHLICTTLLVVANKIKKGMKSRSYAVQKNI